MSRPLENKLALVTGSSRGIGAAVVARLAKDGASVIVNYASRGQRADDGVARRPLARREKKMDSHHDEGAERQDHRRPVSARRTGQIGPFADRPDQPTRAENSRNEA
jgi:NAD(P)-dependent dehydrogenase (short-subunit alcohol dehydrogenase family)